MGQINPTNRLEHKEHEEIITPTRRRKSPMSGSNNKKQEIVHEVSQMKKEATSKFHQSVAEGSVSGFEDSEDLRKSANRILKNIRKKD